MQDMDVNGASRGTDTQNPAKLGRKQLGESPDLSILSCPIGTQW